LTGGWINMRQRAAAKLFVEEKPIIDVQQRIRTRRRDQPIAISQISCRVTPQGAGLVWGSGMGWV
jgi:hypothetical protein